MSPQTCSNTRTTYPPPITRGSSPAPVPTTPSFTAPSPARPPRFERLPEAYLALAEDHERRTALFAGWRERLVERLALRRGDVVIDVGCGSGLNFPALRARVGRRGRIIGLDASPQMLAVAAQSIALRGWANVTLINAPAETAELPAGADAALFCAGHDVLQSRAALANIFGHLRAGAAVAAGGGKLPSRWLWPLRALVRALYSPYVSDFTAFDQPWRLLADYLTPLQLTDLGTGYLAHAHTPARSPSPDKGGPRGLRPLRPSI